MTQEKYPIVSPHLVMKQGAYNTKKYFIKDMKSKMAGFANEDLKNILILCNGTNKVADIINHLVNVYDVPRKEIEKKVSKSLLYFRNMNYIKFMTKPKLQSITIKSKLKWSLDIAYLEVTRRCNLSCIHCYNNSSPKAVKKDLNTKSIFALIDRLNELGTLEIVITGGEPLIRRDIFEIMQYVVDRNMSFNLFTNGTLLNENKIKKLKILQPEYIAVSLDSTNPKIHNKIRGQDCFSKVIKNVTFLIKNGVPVRINTTIFNGLNDKQDDIRNMIEFLIDKGVEQVAIDGFMSYGRGRKYKHFVSNPILAKIILNAFRRRAKHIKPKIEKLPSLKFSDSFVSEGSKISVSSVCGIGTFACTIRSNGNVVLCPVLTDKTHCAGNFLKKDLKDIWLNSDIFNVFRNTTINDISKCKICSHKRICLGGCKAKALMYNGRFDSPDLWMCSMYS